MEPAVGCKKSVTIAPTKTRTSADVFIQKLNRLRDRKSLYKTVECDAKNNNSSLLILLRVEMVRALEQCATSATFLLCPKVKQTFKTCANIYKTVVPHKKK